MSDSPRIAFLASSAPDAQQALQLLSARHGQHAPEDADVICPLGGDGFMLQTLHRHGGLGRPVYGMKLGTVGFLMNHHRPDGLVERLALAEPAKLRPLEMLAQTESGASTGSLAYNEVSLLRQTRQAAHIRIDLNGQTRVDELICDGVLVSTPAGSSAYNLSAHGPIVPLDANLLPLTPISAFRPRRWRGALLPASAQVLFEILESDKRPVAAVADYTEVRNVVSVSVAEDRGVALSMLFDPDHSLSERIIAEQFTA